MLLHKCFSSHLKLLLSNWLTCGIIFVAQKNSFDPPHNMLHNFLLTYYHHFYACQVTHDTYVGDI